MPDDGASGPAVEAAPRVRGGGRLDLDFAVDADGATRIVRQFASYPFHLCRPFRYPGDPEGMATLYLQSCSGGIYAGERLEVEIAVRAGAAVHLTTQAATIARGMRNGGAVQAVALRAAEASLVEYLPDPTILFPDCDLETGVAIVLDPSARLIICKSFLRHDPAGAGRVFTRLVSALTLRDPSGRLLVRDRFAIAGEAWAGACPGVTGTAAGLATILAVGPGAAALLPVLRTAIDDDAGTLAGASLLAGEVGVSCRLLASDGARLRSGIGAAWKAVRRHWTGRDPVVRRK